MNVFLPLLRSSNSFLDELENKFDGKFIYDYYENIDLHQVDIINIHWPESVFVNNNYEYEKFKTWLLRMREKIPVVYTRHNSLPHRIVNKYSAEFNDFVNINCDAVHHFGEYSLREHKNLYPEYSGLHSVIPHPYYSALDNSTDFIEARKKLGIAMDKKVILIFGTIRNDAERRFVLDFFDSLNLKDSVLLVPNFGYFQSPDFIKNTKLGRAYSKLKTFFYKRKNRIIESKYIPNDDVQYYFKASDVLFIPRVNALNSGVIYLGLTFNVKIVAPRAGNITELVKGNNVIYEPGNLKHFQKQITDLVMLDSSAFSNGIDSQQFQPKQLGFQLKEYFHSVIDKHRNCNNVLQ